mgnify:CR=1 FL=1
MKYITSHQDDGVRIYAIGPARKVRALCVAEAGRLPRWLCGVGRPTNAAQRRARQRALKVNLRDIPF